MVWLTSARKPIVSYTSPSYSFNGSRYEPGVEPQPRPASGTKSVTKSEPEWAFEAARDLRQPVYSRLYTTPQGLHVFQVQVPLIDRSAFVGTLVAEYSVEALLRYCAQRGGEPAWRDAPRRQRLGCWRAPSRRVRSARAAVHLARHPCGAGGQRTDPARAGLPHVRRADRQHAVLDGGGAVRPHRLDVFRHVAPHATPAAGPKRTSPPRRTSAARWRTPCSPACARWTWKAASPT